MARHRRQFGPLRVEYDERVLEPRAWTIVQSRRAAQLLEHAPAGPIVELHCGAGHIGEAAALWADRALVQVDDDEVCCTWARHNARANNVDATVHCTPVAALHAHEQSFALLLADPPYVPSAETARFPDDPLHTIDGGTDGLDGFRACLPVAARLVRPGGAVVLQARGAAQADLVTDLATDVAPELHPLARDVVASDRAILAYERR